MSKRKCFPQSELPAAWSLIEWRLQGKSNSALLSSSFDRSVDVAVCAVNNAPALINQAALEPPSHCGDRSIVTERGSVAEMSSILTSIRSRQNEAVSCDFLIVRT